MQAKASVSVSSLPLLRYPSSPAAGAARRRPQPSRRPCRRLSVDYDLVRHHHIISARSSSSSCSAAAAAASTAAAAPEPQKVDKDVVFVAGATGRVGSRVVRELIKLGFRVRAAVRSAERASSLLKSVEQLKLDDEAAAAAASSSASAAEKLELVECDLEKQAAADIASAIGDAALVVCSIGASEKEVLDVTGPYRIDYMATKNLVQAATAAKVEHFILVTSLGTSKFGLPASLLNLFWGVLCWKRRAEEALIASGLPYTIVRPGGMERPTDAFKETHNLVVAAQDTYAGGLVSNLQVAELIAFMARNRKAAYCKVVEVIAETTAPLLPMDQLLSTVPSDTGPPAAAKGDEEAPAAAGEATARAQQPLSPYTAYEGLKPPSSPSPTSSAGAKEKDAAEAQAASSGSGSDRPLPPYTTFVDLKPPSSPSPSSSATDASIDLLLDSNDNGTPTPISGRDGEVDRRQLQQEQRPLSPYTRYEELKPPSSPTPSTPQA